MGQSFTNAIPQKSCIFCLIPHLTQYNCGFEIIIALQQTEPRHLLLCKNASYHCTLNAQTALRACSKVTDAIYLYSYYRLLFQKLNQGTVTPATAPFMWIKLIIVFYNLFVRVLRPITQNNYALE